MIRHGEPKTKRPDGRDEWRARTIALSSRLRARTWDHMAQDFVANVTSA